MLLTCASAWAVQEQRRLQLSLEAHGRYITSLIQKKGLEGLPPQTKEALDAALVPPQGSGDPISPI